MSEAATAEIVVVNSADRNETEDAPSVRLRFDITAVLKADLSNQKVRIFSNVISVLWLYETIVQK